MVCHHTIKVGQQEHLLLGIDHNLKVADARGRQHDQWLVKVVLGFLNGWALELRLLVQVKLGHRCCALLLLEALATWVVLAVVQGHQLVKVLLVPVEHKLLQSSLSEKQAVSTTLLRLHHAKLKVLLVVAGHFLSKLRSTKPSSFRILSSLASFWICCLTTAVMY